MSTLRAAVAAVPVPAPNGVDLVGFLRRWAPADGNNQPLQAGVIVFEGNGVRCAVVALDTGSVVRPFADRLRSEVAEAIGSRPDAVFVNASHTHAAPPLPGHLKTGGTTGALRPEELRYAEDVAAALSATAAEAAGRLVPARVGFATGEFDGGVNRRQRTPDGGTIMGWNPDGFRDTTVAVLRVDTEHGDPLATVVSYGCHPVVLGPDVTCACADFVAPLRRVVSSATGAPCLFLQGCAGNVFPLEALHGSPGPEVTFGTRLAHRVLVARDEAEPWRTVLREQVVQSASPMAMWRRERSEAQPEQRVGFSQTEVSLKLQGLPSLEEIRALRADLEDRHARARDSGEPREGWNALWLHAEWARGVERSILDGSISADVPAPVGALVVGPITFVTLPCEPFAEIGASIKDELGDGTVVLGYTNHMIGYVPTREEFARGGYEPWLAPRHFGRPAPFDEGTADELVRTAVRTARDARARAREIPDRERRSRNTTEVTST
ncbi:hypothetical protein [Streptomyces sp. NPDC055607]